MHSQITTPAKTIPIATNRAFNVPPPAEWSNADRIASSWTSNLLRTLTSPVPPLSRHSS